MRYTNPNKIALTHAEYRALGALIIRQQPAIKAAPMLVELSKRWPQWPAMQVKSG